MIIEIMIATSALSLVVIKSVYDCYKLNNDDQDDDFLNYNAPVTYKYNALSECPICLECYSSKVVRKTICGHLFCSMCIEDWFRKNNRCPLCNFIFH